MVEKRMRYKSEMKQVKSWTSSQQDDCPWLMVATILTNHMTNIKSLSFSSEYLVNHLKLHGWLKTTIKEPIGKTFKHTELHLMI